MPNLSALLDQVTLSTGTFERGKWDYIGLAQRYPSLEAIKQLVPRKVPATNREATILYQTATDAEPHGMKSGDPVQPAQQKKALRRKVALVKCGDELGWTLDQDTLLGKSDEHIAKQVQLDFVDFDLRWWQYLDESLLRLPTSGTPDDDEPMFGFPAWITEKSGITSNEFDLYGGGDPYTAGRPGNITVAAQSKYTNPTAAFQAVSDDDFFDKVEEFLILRKLIGAVPNPRLLPDTSNDVLYTNVQVAKTVQRYLTASNENIGVDAGAYRGKGSYKGIPIVVWHAACHQDSPVADADCKVRLIDWNSFQYYVQPAYDRKTSGPTDINLVPGGIYVTTETWHQIVCNRPDRNLLMVSDTAALQP